MKIVILDGHTLNPGDLSWKSLEELGKLTIYDRTPKSLVVERCAGALAVFTNKCVLGKEELQLLPDLKYIGVLATGYNVVDCAYCTQHNITVCNVPAYSTDSVVQTILGLIISCLTKLPDQIDSVRRGQWSRSSDFSYYPTNCREISNKTIGIIGYGRIGRKLTDVMLALGAEVLVYNKGKIYESKNNVTYTATCDELLSRSDIVSLNCPLTVDNEKMINSTSIATMKEGAVLINAARGGLIDEYALARALNTGYLAAAGLDVLSSEPPSPDNPLLTAKNAFITPHTAWATIEARTRLMDITVGNFKAFLDGNCVNKVN
ncbi:MAG: D-2-hydroxyacid dehydrogenase [Christensenellaceae bacterium]|jgi:glycerate dehydrogenase|nr:D-2-hydroxyacid dehydrogenase [Christensenellaceae bacterium]